MVVIEVLFTENKMQSYNGFNELAAAQCGGGHDVNNVMFIGEPEQGDIFDAHQKQELINITEEIVRSAEKRVKQKAGKTIERDEIRQQVNRIVKGLIDTHKGRYADLKKELLEFGVEAVSDSFHYDGYFDEKYGGVK